MRIEANGIYNGQPLTVVCESDGESDSFAYSFNGSENKGLEYMLTAEADAGHAIGGTYYPETLALKLVTALDGWFFDYPPQDEIKVDEELEEIPFEPDVIY